MLPNYPYFIDTCGKPDYLCNSNSSVLVACTVGSNPTTPANKIENDQFKIIELLQEVIGDIKNYELEIRIEKLESKFSKDLDENTFNEIRELKKSQKIN